jgi:membrane-bound lytic murein transglycosylase D
MLPVEKIGDFLAHEKDIYLASEVKKPEPEPVLADTASADGGAGQTTKVIWEDQWKTHKVKKGETLKGVSSKYGVTSSDIKKWNKLKSSTLKVGQNLKVKVKVKKTITIPKVTEPADTTSTTTPKVTPPAPDPKPTPPKPAAPKEEYVYYTVKSGDSLSSIASKNRVSVDSIVKLNKGLSPNKIQVGQKIKIKKK